MGEVLLSFEDIQKSFGSHTILQGVNLDIYQGELIGLVGKSGCGKTTFLRIVTGFYEADAGKLNYQSQDYAHNKLDMRRIIGLATQDNSFYEELTVTENLRYYGKMYDMSENYLNQRIPELTSLVELSASEHTVAKNLSGGMRRRLDFAISLIHDPSILIFDEPLTGLDPIIRYEMWTIIRQIQKLGKTIIMSSHDLEELAANCSRIAIMHKGQICDVRSLKSYLEKYQPLKYFTHIFTKIVQND